jgi:hypothetical protein
VVRVPLLLSLLLLLLLLPLPLFLRLPSERAPGISVIDASSVFP